MTGTQRHRRHRPGDDLGPVAVLEGLQTQFALRCLGKTCGKFATILADPPWRFSHRTGKIGPEHKRLTRYPTMTLAEIMSLPVEEIAADQSHLYLWIPNALLDEGLLVLDAWGFTYKSNLVWYKTRKDGGPDGRGMRFYFRNVTELALFGTRGSLRTGDAGRRQVNIITAPKREHSRKPDELYDIIEKCSYGPFLELFARHPRPGWAQWGNEIEQPRGDTRKAVTGKRRRLTTELAFA